MIVLTTPTGQIGRQVLDTLLDAGEPIRVIARDPTRLAPRAHGRVEIVQGSHGDLDVLDRAFDGADAVFWLVPPHPRAETVEAAYLDFTRPACDAFKRHEVKRVVGVSALGRGTAVAGNAGQVTATLAMDDLIASTGVGYRALALSSFMDNMLRQVAPIKHQGVFFSPFPGDRRLPTCATRDAATVAAGLLRDDSWRGYDSVPLLGPEDLSFDDQARIISEVLGKPVRFQQISAADFKATLTARGTSEAMAQATVDMMRAKNEGLDDAEPRTPRSTTTPTTFRRWCEDVLKPAVLA